MANKTFAYIRVSSKEQKEDRQVEAIKEYCKAKNIDIEERNVIVDKQSGKDFNRAGYKALKEQLLRQGDILIIKELDRLGRDMQMIKDEWQELIKAGVDITIIDNEILNTLT